MPVCNRTPGSLGGSTNCPAIDPGTLPRCEHKGPATTGLYGPAPKMAAWAMREGIRRAMRLNFPKMHLKGDEFGEELFELWFTGRGAPETTLDTDRWAAYMRASKEINEQIDVNLKRYAAFLRERVDAGPGQLADRFEHRFHAEVGGEAGGYLTGYELLHGTNRNAGDFRVTGRFVADRKGPPSSAYKVTFTDLAFEWNDLMDINRTYKMDISLGRATANIARELGQGPPRDFTVHIRWKADFELTAEVPAEVKGAAPAWLKTYGQR